MTACLHEPAPDRLLGPLVSPLAQRLDGQLSPAVLSLLATGAAGAALGALAAGAHVIGGLLIALAALLDAAASTMRAGTFATVLDGLSDRYADALIVAGLAVWSHAHEDQAASLAVGFVALAGVLGLLYMQARVRASAGVEAARVFRWTGRDLRLLIAAAGALSGQAYAALLLIAVITHLPVLWALARLKGQL